MGRISSLISANSSVDLAPSILCPTTYNKSFSKVKYLEYTLERTRKYTESEKFNPS